MTTPEIPSVPAMEGSWLTIADPHVLLVEGTEEVHFFKALARRLGLQRFQVLPYQGKTRLRDYLMQFVIAPEYDKVVSLAVTRDADCDWQAALASVRSSLSACGLPVPDGPLQWAGSGPRVCIMILPASNANGMLENLCLRSVAEDPAMDCVSDYFSCLQEQGISLRGNRMAKAKVHAFLASRAEPDLRLGEAAGRKYWPFDHEAFDEVTCLLQQLTTTNF